MPLTDYDGESLYEEVPLPKRRLRAEEQQRLDEGEISEAEADALRKSSFKVRGISLVDATHLVQHHLGDLTKAVELYSQRKAGRMSRATMADFAMILARDFPALVVELISVCADEPDQQEKVAKLPLMIQITALLTISKLTMEEAGGLKNLLAFLEPLARGLLANGASEPGTLQRKLLAFIGGSGSTPAS